MSTSWRRQCSCIIKHSLCSRCLPCINVRNNANISDKGKTLRSTSWEYGLICFSQTGLALLLYTVSNGCIKIDLFYQTKHNQTYNYQILIQIMQQLSSRKENRPKISEYKGMIEELLQQIKKIGAQNQSLKKQLAQVQSNMSQALQKVNKIQQLKEKAQRSKKELEQQLANDKFHFTLQSTNKNNEMITLRQENQMLKDQSLILTKEKNEYIEQLSKMKKQNAFLSQKIEKIIEQKQTIQQQMIQKDKYHHLQVQQLKKINVLIKNNFQTIEKDYESLLKLNEQESSSFTIQRPQKRNKQGSHKLTKKANHRSSSNPQMQEQLLKIKQQVSQQIVRINSNRQQAVKGRVDKTLATIQSILSSMSNRVYSSDQQSD